MALLIGLIDSILRLFELLIIVHAVVSWFRGDRYNRALALLDSVVDPVLYPIRRALHPYMRGVPLDISPMVAILLIEVVRQVVLVALVRSFA
ncbi:MAG: YggT family protein [Armatimonadota bacterium]